MATPIRDVPTLTGRAAREFVKKAQEVERNPHTKECKMSEETFKKILASAKFDL
ncbi:hypothetical protein EZS27_001412 [termite gut metagenome]|uniref:Uncharacterized protein n=1 Tax=termite gut metagenome TaxID=433724 RepID=A0A5J4SYD1_9ZZZZ